MLLQYQVLHVHVMCLLHYFCCRQGPPCYLLIGPEGDFTSAEVHSLAGAGVLPVGLGNNRLRTETAAMALLAAATLYSDAATIHAGESRSTNRQL